MKLYLTHIGVMALGSIPLLRLPQIWPKTISVKLTANKYMRIDCRPNGVFYVNDLLGGIDATHWMRSEAVNMAEEHHMEILGTVEYLKY